MSWNLAQPFESLDGTVAVITGAAGGIGSDMTKTLVDLGVTVVAGDLNPDTIEASDNVIPILADAGTEEGTAAAVAAVEATGKRPSLWVNNAAAIARGPAYDHTVEDIDRIMDVNVRGTFIGSCAAHRLMAPHSAGAIVNIASLTATRVQKGRPVYGPSKAAVASMTAYLGSEWGPTGVTVNAVAPGYIDTQMSVWYRLDEEGREALLEDIPQRRLGVPADITSMVITLASPLASYVTGQTFRVDGGWTV